MANFTIIKPSVERIHEKDNLKRIELAGRVCYKSEKNITEDSALDFCKRIMESGHTSVLEHSNVIVKVPIKIGSCIIDNMRIYEDWIKKIAHLKYTYPNDGTMIFSGNVRAWREILECFPMFTFTGDPLLNVTHEGTLLDLTPYMISEDKLTKKEREVHSRITLRIVCDRGVSHELVRHRVMSFSQESTRYVNYGRKDFTFIEPWWWEHQNGVLKHYLISTMQRSSATYEAMIADGATPQLARAILPNQIKTEVVVTATPLQWADFLKLRMDKAAHPDMQRIAQMVHDALGEDLHSHVEV
jgi:thymidylate synthase (FAD)